MAQFTNQAQLTYGTTVVNSNVAVGEILEALSVTKTAVSNSYSAGEKITYIVSIVNMGGTAYTGLTVADDLGAYELGTGALVPLSYVDGSIKYYVNGVLQPTPELTAGTGLTISGISVPANGNALLIYETEVNQYAPIGDGGAITNTATLNGSLINPISDSETVNAVSAPSITVTKTITPVPVADNGTVTYTFLIQNTGSRALVATDNAVITDTFSPILTNVTATLNGTLLAEGTDYTYSETTGLFQTAESVVTVPAGTFTQDPVTGIWSITPGTSTLVITGTI